MGAPFSFAGSVVLRSLSACFFQKDRIFAMDERRLLVQSRAAARPSAGRKPSASSACRPASREAMGEVLSTTPLALAFGLMLGAMMLPEPCLAIDCDCKP